MKSEYIEEDKIKEIALQIQSEFQMGGLADGIYLDFAIEVAKRYDDFRRGTISKGFIKSNFINQSNT